MPQTPLVCSADFATVYWTPPGPSLFWRDRVSTGLMNGTGYGAAQAQWLLRHRQQFKPKATKKGEYQKGLDKGVICDQDLDFREFGIDND